MKASNDSMLVTWLKHRRKTQESCGHLWRTSVNFLIHRLHLKQYRQKQDEYLDDFTTRARTLANKCQFPEVKQPPNRTHHCRYSLWRSPQGTPCESYWLPAERCTERKSEIWNTTSMKWPTTTNYQTDRHPWNYFARSKMWKLWHKPAYKEICKVCMVDWILASVPRKSRMQRRTRISSGKRRGSNSGRRKRPNKQNKYKRTPSSDRRNARVDAVGADYETDGLYLQSPSAHNVLMKSATDRQHVRKCSLFSTGNHPDSREMVIRFDWR